MKKMYKVMMVIMTVVVLMTGIPAVQAQTQTEAERIGANSGYKCTDLKLEDGTLTITGYFFNYNVDVEISNMNDFYLTFYDYEGTKATGAYYGDKLNHLILPAYSIVKHNFSIPNVELTQAVKNMWLGCYSYPQCYYDYKKTAIPDYAPSSTITPAPSVTQAPTYNNYTQSSGDVYIPEVDAFKNIADKIVNSGSYDDIGNTDSTGYDNAVIPKGKEAYDCLTCNSTGTLKCKACNGQGFTTIAKTGYSGYGSSRTSYKYDEIHLCVCNGGYVDCHNCINGKVYR